MRRRFSSSALGSVASCVAVDSEQTVRLEDDRCHVSFRIFFSFFVCLSFPHCFVCAEPEGIYLYWSFLGLMTTQRSLQYDFTIHHFPHTFIQCIVH